MATIENRSRYTISVKNREDLYREFPFTQLAKAKQYATELKAQGYKPFAGQKEDAFFVRIRSKGYPAQQFTLPNLQEAETVIARIEAEHSQSMFIDYGLMRLHSRLTISTKLRA